MKYIFIVLVSILIISNIAYANNCKLIDTKSGYTGEIVFRCDENISLADNELSFIVDSSNIDGIDNVWINNGYTDYLVKRQDDGFKVTANVYKTWTQNNPYIIAANKNITLRFTIKDNSSSNYKIKWLGVAANPNAPEENKIENAYQFGRNSEGLIYAFKDKLYCHEGADCIDKKLYISYKCQSNGDCDAIDKINSIRLGVISEKEE